MAYELLQNTRKFMYNWKKRNSFCSPLVGLINFKNIGKPKCLNFLQPDKQNKTKQKAT